MSAEVLGAANLARGIHRFAENLGKMSPPEAGRIMLSAARERAPVDSGALRASGTTVGAGITFSVPYASPVHWGSRTRNRPPNRFALEGARATERAWLGVFNDDMQAGLNRIEGV